jgi:hypothetical protein
MIEITCLPSGDTAEAADPEAALVAALALCADDAEAWPIRGRDRSVTFTFPDGNCWSVSERDLWVAP